MSNIIYNQGDTIKYVLDVTFNGNIVTKDSVDEIEFYVHETPYTLGNGRVIWSEEDNRYIVELTQEETFKLPNMFKTQIRIKNGKEVGSTEEQLQRIGKTISKTIL